MTIRSTFRNFKCIAVAFVLFLIGINYACSSDPSNLEGNNSLWKIHSSTNTVYILGSLHYFKEEHFPLDEVIEQAFNSAQKIVFEVHPDSVLSTRATQLAMRMAMYQNGEALGSSLSDSTYRLTLKKASSLGINLEQLVLFEPWFVATNLASIKLESLNFAPNSGIDFYFFHKAMETKKEIIALETIEYQISLFDDISAEEQELFLLQTLADLEQADQIMENAISAWFKGDVVELENVLLKDTYDLPELYAKVFVERNKNWASRIERFLRDQSNYLVVVGAGHLVGDHSVLKILESQGYEVEQF